MFTRCLLPLSPPLYTWCTTTRNPYHLRCSGVDPEKRLDKRFSALYCLDYDDNRVTVVLKPAGGRANRLSVNFSPTGVKPMFRLFKPLLPKLMQSVLVIEPAPGSGASGSMADMTFSHNRFGAYVRSRTKPVNPNSARQQKMRGIMALLTTRWGQTLTEDQRTAWELYGSSVVMKNRIGQDIYLTGFNHYLRSNSVLQDMGVALIDEGPTTFELPAKDPTIIVTASEATQQFDLAFDDTMAWPQTDNNYMYHLTGKPQNAQRNFFGGPWRGFRFLTGDTAVPLVSPQVLGALFHITQGQRAWTQYRIIREDGRLSEPFQAQCIVGA